MDVLKESDRIITTIKKVLKQEKKKHKNVSKNNSDKLPAISIVAEHV